VTNYVAEVTKEQFEKPSYYRDNAAAYDAFKFDNSLRRLKMPKLQEALEAALSKYKGERLSQVFEDGSIRFFFVKVGVDTSVIRVCVDAPIPPLEVNSENPDHVAFVGHSLKYYLEGQVLYELQDTFFENEYSVVEVNYSVYEGEIA
jgi:hypothetical protein